MQFLRSLCFISILVIGSFAHAGMSEALSACISASTEDLIKSRVNGTSDTVVSIICSGDEAQTLWEEVKFYAREWGPTVSDTHQKRMVRSFGNLGVPSECLRTYEDAAGRSVNYYTCFISIDLNSAVTKAM